MTINRKVTGTASSIPAGIASGVLAATAVMLTGTLISAVLVDREVLSWQRIGYAVMAILIISSWIGASVSAGRVKRRRLLICAASGLAYFMLLLAMTGLFFGGKYRGVGETGLLILCGSMLAVFGNFPVKAGGNRRKTRRHHG